MSKSPQDNIDHIFIIDDDKNITLSISMALKNDGYKVSIYHNGAEALEGLSQHSPNLILLDIKMPVMDGIEFLKAFRTQYKIPVIILSSKSDEIDQIVGFRFGADDYVTKPFSQRVLMERIRTLLKKEQLIKNYHVDDEANTFNVVRGPLQLDLKKRQCFWKREQIDLTVTEFQIIEILAQNPDHIKSREQLVNIAYGSGPDADDRVIDSHIKRLRKKFKDVDPDFKSIKTQYGSGYCFTLHNCK